MRSALRGKPTSDVEVTNISKHGFWLLIGDQELFLPFEYFPWFQDVPIGKLLHVELPHPHHVYWPKLDVDLAVESIEHPERFPLVSRSPSNKPLSGAVRRRSPAPRRTRG